MEKPYFFVLLLKVRVIVSPIAIRDGRLMW
jgi:hypothetical protein